jgi:hypothetical protein
MWQGAKNQFPVSTLADSRAMEAENCLHAMNVVMYIDIFLFTGTRVVQNLLGMLKAHGVKKVAGLFRDVISGTSGKSSGLGGEEPRPWNNKERMYATDLFAR